jgi:hypothetical protein
LFGIVAGHGWQLGRSAFALHRILREGSEARDFRREVAQEHAISIFTTGH